MPKQSFGPITQHRTQTLLMGLVQFANDSLALEDEKILVGLRSNIKTHWQTDQRLVVQTTARHLVALTQYLETPLTLAQVKAGLKHLQTFIGILEDHRTSQRGSDQWHFTLTLWQNRWEEETNQQTFDQVWNQHRPDRAVSQPSTTETTSPWRACCQAALDTRLTSNPLTAHTGLAFDLKDVYCPVGLVAYQTDAAKQTGDSAAESDLESIVYQPDQFLDVLLAQPEIQRVAIVGPPGAGKTTLLQTLALKLLAQEQVLPIWISLADLEGQSLETYLLETWLKQTLKVFTVPLSQQQAFAQQFATGKVWLLLDAVDEMGMVPSQALAFVAKQLKGWLGAAHVILTSRSQLWDTGHNALEAFTPYRSLSFSYRHGGNQVQTVIQNWFHNQQGDTLYHQINRPEMRRLKALIQNPLHLALLCRTWQLTQGQLPETKAMLYRQFVEALYDWKQDHHPTSLGQRQQLNQALAHLALQAMAQPSPLFRLPEIFVSQQLDPDQLTLALQLGWLQPAGWSPTTGGKVYAFYHATFQEYFAAQGIADWHQLIEYQNAETTFHPIFRSQWQEVILLWLGRSDIADVDKADFLQALVNFADGCGGFYETQAKLLATKGLAEYPQFAGAETLVTEVVHWRFQQQTGKPTVWIEPAAEALSHCDRTLVTTAIEQFVAQASNPFEQWLAAHSLGKSYDPGNGVAIATLEQLLSQAPNEDLRIEMAKSLGDIQPGHPQAIQTLQDIIQSHDSLTLRRKAAHRLGTIAPDQPMVLQTLEHILQTTDDPCLRRQTLQSLQQLAPQHSALPVEPSRRRSRKTPLNPEQLIPVLEQKLQKSRDIETRIRYAGRLGRLQPNHKGAIDILLELLPTTHRKTHLKQMGLHLQQAITPEEDSIPPTLVKAISVVQWVYTQSPHLSQVQATYRLLWHWSKAVSFEQFRVLWQANSSAETSPYP